MSEEYQIQGSPHPSEVKRPSVMRESVSIVEPIRLLGQYRKLVRNKKGNGQRIILFPGWNSHEKIMYPMKKYLSRLGYTPEYWGLGMNYGKIEEYRDRLVEQLKQEETEEKITLIGWSLGGVVAREIARELPDRISGVITYGTPVVGGPKYTIGAKIWDKVEVERIIATTEELDTNHPIQVPMSIIFTKKDSFVTWSACLDYRSKQVKHYEVNATHASMIINPEVWGIVAEHLEHYSE